MIDQLKATFLRLLDDVVVETKRFLFADFNINQRLTGLIGPRGVGKTTLLLQYIKANFTNLNNVLYFSADHIYFSDHTLLEFIDHLYRIDGITFFFIDEIHKYTNWSQELKNIYDSYPKIKIVFSGSSSIDLIEGTYDLSRRAKLLHLPGLSFREYLNIETKNEFEAISFDELIADHQKIAAHFSKISTISKHFEDYTAFGYY